VASHSDGNTYVHVDTSASASVDDKDMTQVRSLNKAHLTWQYQNYSMSLLEIENKEPIFLNDFFIVVTSTVVCTGHVSWQDLSWWHYGEIQNGELMTTWPTPKKL